MFKWNRSELLRFGIALLTWIVKPEAAWSMIVAVATVLLTWLRNLAPENIIIYSLGAAAFTALLVNQTRQIRYAKILPFTTDKWPSGTVKLPAVQPGKLGEKYFCDVRINIADLLKEGLVLKGRTFERCQLVGPALLRPIKGIFSECIFRASFPTDAARDFTWVVPEGRNLVGVIGIEDCIFQKCLLIDIAVVGRNDEVASWISDMTPLDEHTAVKS